jgi:hypothetical protein
LQHNALVEKASVLRAVRWNEFGVILRPSSSVSQPRQISGIGRV